MVWSLLEAKKLGVMPKLEPAYEGPFLVKANYADIDFLLQMDKFGREKLYHHDKLKPYRGDCPTKMAGEGKEDAKEARLGAFREGPF